MLSLLVSTWVPAKNLDAQGKRRGLKPDQVCSTISNYCDIYLKETTSKKEGWFWVHDLKGFRKQLLALLLLGLSPGGLSWWKGCVFYSDQETERETSCLPGRLLLLSSCLGLYPIGQFCSHSERAFITHSVAVQHVSLFWKHPVDTPALDCPPRHLSKQSD